VGVLLSGGLDSRAAAYACRQPDMKAFTFGDYGTADVVYARKISKILGFQHDHLAFNPWRWKESLPQVAHASDGEASIEHYRSIQFHHFLAEHCDSLMTGVLGDVITGSALKPVLMRDLSPEEILSYAYHSTLLPHTSSLRKTKEWNLLDDIAVKVIENSLEGNESELAGDKITAWNIENRQRMLIMTGPHSDRTRFRVLSPFFDFHVHSFMRTIPIEQRFKQKLYVKALWEMMPELRKIPWQKTGIPPNPNGRFVLPRKAIARVKSKVGLAPKRGYVDLNYMIRNAFKKEELHSMLISGQERIGHTLVTRQSTQRILDEQFAGANHGSLIMSLLTLWYAESGVVTKAERHRPPLPEYPAVHYPS
jgi:hypothetical protein